MFKFLKNDTVTEIAEGAFFLAVIGMVIALIVGGVIGLTNGQAQGELWMATGAAPCAIIAIVALFVTDANPEWKGWDL